MKRDREKERGNESKWFLHPENGIRLAARKCRGISWHLAN